MRSAKDSGIREFPKSDSVTEAVTERILVSRTVDYVACGGVDLRAVVSRADSLQPRLLRAEHGVVQALHFFVRASEYDGARHVGAVSFNCRTVIHREESRLEQALRG